MAPRSNGVPRRGFQALLLVSVLALAALAPGTVEAQGAAPNITLSPAGGTIGVTWTGVSGANRYRVQWKSGSESYSNTRQKESSSSRGTFINELTGGVEYTVRVQARFGSTWGDWSAEKKARVFHPQLGKVPNLRVRGVAGNMRWSWGAVTNAAEYRFQWKAPGEDWSSSRQFDYDSTTTNVAATNDIFTPGLTYTFRVRAMRDHTALPASWSDEVRLLVGAQTPLQVDPPTVMVRPEALEVSWRAGADVTSYLLQWKSGDQSYDENRQITVPGTDTSATIEGLDGGIEYSVRVIATRQHANANAPPSREITGTPLNRGVTVSEAALMVSEPDGAATYTLVLDFRPTGDVTITLASTSTSTDTNAATVSPATLTFTTGNWDTPQTVTVTGVNDSTDNSDNQRTVTITHTAVGGHYDDAPIASVEVTVTDDDETSVTLSETSVTVAEAGGTANYTVVLGTRPSEDVTITLTSTDTDAATVSPETLTFTTNNWNTARTVTVTGVNDTLDNPGDQRMARITHAAAGGGYDDTVIDAVTVTVTDDDTVTDDNKGIERRNAELVLAGTARTMVSDAVDMLAGRFAAPSAGGAQMRLGGHALRLTGASLPDGREPGPDTWHRAGVAFDGEPGRTRVGGGWRSDPMEEASWRGTGETELSERDLLTGSSFELPLSAAGGEGGAGAWAVWGRGAASGFGSKPEPDFSLDGEFYSGYLGLEMQPRPSARLGLAVSLNQGTVEHERTGGTKAETDVKLTSVLPYVHWRPRAGLGLWGLFGVGSGDMEVTVDGASDAQTADLTSYLGAVGGRQALSEWWGMDLAVKADAFAGTLRSEEREGVPGARGDAGRVRMAMEGSWTWPVGPDSRLSPRVELGGRWDGGTAERGLGVEVGGGFAYTHTAVGLSVEAQGRYLVAHQASSFDQWGASMSVSLDPGAAGRGASLTVAPMWGQAASATERLWADRSALDPLGSNAGPENAGWTPQHLDVALEYGLPLSWDRGMVTPYGGMTLGSSDAARYRLGSRLTLDPSLDLSVEGARTERDGLPASHGVSAQLGMRW